MQLELEFPNVPPYRVRRSARARRPSVTVCLHEGVVLTLPARFDERRVPALLAEWRPWIDRQLGKFEQHRARLPAAMRAELPDRIHLPAMAGAWEVSYRRRRSDYCRAIERAGRVEIASRQPDEARPALRRWLARKARHHLAAELEQLASRHGLAYRRLTIRGQRTRWGSCSSTGTISLNYLLMFLSPDAARSVVLHELCHTRYMSHGPRFYGLLERLEPRYRQLDREVQDGWLAIPAWAWPAR